MLRIKGDEHSWIRLVSIRMWMGCSVSDLRSENAFEGTCGSVQGWDRSCTAKVKISITVACVELYVLVRVFSIYNECHLKEDTHMSFVFNAKICIPLS